MLSGSHPREVFPQPTPEEEREADVWSFALDHVYRMGRQVAELRAGKLEDLAGNIHNAASRFILGFEVFYGIEGRRSLSATYRMSQMESGGSLWMEAGRWRA